MNCLHRIYLTLLVLFLAGCQWVPVEERHPSRGGKEEHSASRLYVKTAADWAEQLSAIDPLDRAWAAYQLGKLEQGATPAIAALIALLKDDTPVLLSRYVGGGYRSSNDTTPGDEAAQALMKIGQNAVPALLDALALPNAKSRRLAAKALGQIGDHVAIRPLIKLLADPDRQVRAAAAIALGSFRYPAAAQTIADQLPSVTAEQRIDMIYALGQVGEVIVVPTLLARVATETPEVRAATMYALGRLRDGRAVASLLQGLHDSDERVRANAAFALSQYGSAPVISDLIAALDDPSMRVREAAQEALQSLTTVNLPPERAQWAAWWRSQQHDSLEISTPTK